MKAKISSVLILSFFIFLSNNSVAQEFEGYALYNHLSSQNAYLIDKEGEIAHTWNCEHVGNYAVLLKDNGNIVRGAYYDDNELEGAAVGGRVQEIDPQGDIVWDFVYSSPDYVQHHDITLMPNGGVLIIAWQVIKKEELDSLGYDGNQIERWATSLIEIQQEGTGGKIVWEWHIKDHFVQDVDPNLDNYGVISEHPELLDINLDLPAFFGGDWFHVNGVNYDPIMDQIVFSSRFLSEIFVIDHSTSIEEASGHDGGNSGMGGDFLYRWGNPRNYGMQANQLIPGPVHDARFIPDDGRYRGGFIQYFSNDGGFTSTVEAIDPPRDGFKFEREEGKPFGPESPQFLHNTLEFAWGQSASDALLNGNTFVAMSGEYMYEVNQNDEVVWQFGEGPAKAFRYTCDHPGIQALLGSDACVGVTTKDLVEADIDISPNPTNGPLRITGSDAHKITSIFVFNTFGQLVEKYDGTNLKSLNLIPGIYTVELRLENNQRMINKISIMQ